MKVWRLTDEAGDIVATVPYDELLNPAQAAKGRNGYGVYEAVDASGYVLYTGRTNNLATRLRAHSTQSPWWGFARDLRWVPCADYAEAVALERSGISTDLGAWNITQRSEIGDSRLHLPDAVECRLRHLYAMTDDPAFRPDFNNFVATLRNAGWTLQSIAAPLSITRERVRQVALSGAVDHDLVVPAVPLKPRRERKVWPRLTDAQRTEIAELSVLAQQVRGWTPVDHPWRVASERLSEALAEARLRGVRFRELAEAAGVSNEAIRFRLGRHGYIHQPQSQSAYKPGSYTPAGPATHCHRGHELSGDNLRLVKGDEKRRVCRACDRIRTDRYRAKNEAA